MIIALILFTLITYIAIPLSFVLRYHNNVIKARAEIVAHFDYLRLINPEMIDDCNYLLAEFDARYFGKAGSK